MARVTGWTIVLMILSTTAHANDPSKSKRRPIIDIHAHALHLEYFDEIGWPNDHWTGEPTPHYTSESLMNATLEAMERYNVVKAVVSGKLELVYSWKAAAPDRIIVGTLTGGPYDIPIDELRLEIAEGRVEVMGEMFTQYFGMEFTDPTAEPYFALAEELKIPVGIHTGLSDLDEIRDGGYTEFRVRLGNPIDLEEVLVRHPKMRIYLMHAGGPFVQETQAIMAMYPQVYIDLASITCGNAGLPDFLRRMILLSGFGKRIMFGTDVYLWPETQYGCAIETIESIEFLSEEQKQDIFCNNAARFLALDEEVCQ